VRALEASFRRGCERPDFRLVHFSIQRDHLHLIVEADDASSLGRGVRALLIRLARTVNRAWKRRGAVVADRYHARLLRTPREVRNAIGYVLRNGSRHRATRGGELDPASSGRWFQGWSRKQAPAPDLPAVAPPRSWLLRCGWSRWGAIDPA
jgi:REP element-mobilizing transposase RayT